MKRRIGNERRAWGRVTKRFAVLAGLLFLPMTGWAARIAESPHNLSVTGPGEVRSMSEDRICIFCHTPHGAVPADAPLWNRRASSSAVYTPYDSPTLKARPGQPTGSSKLCLSCHDGTVALGDVVRGGRGGVSQPISGDARIGTNLSDDHPISFPYADSLAGAPGRFTPPGSWDPRVKLDKTAQLQCTTCHDPHNSDWGAFLVMDNRQSGLCRVCHRQRGFGLTAHAVSHAALSQAQVAFWKGSAYQTVSENACLNCHQPHHAGAPKELLTLPREEDICFACHDGTVASFNLQALFNRPATHPVRRTTGDHQDGENPRVDGRHVECVDCHNPHEARVEPAVPPFIKGAQRGVSGIDAGGSPVREAAYEYEVCFKCHATDGEGGTFRTVVRQVPSTNRLRQFSPSSPSFHPVETEGLNGDVPSLIAPLTESSKIYCTDCHNNDQAQPGVIGSSGPHGSSHPGLLVARYVTDDNVQEGVTSAFALCFRCHSSASILGNEGWSKHAGHIQRVRASCSACHDPHGIDYQQGNSRNNAHLINFDRAVVKEYNGRIEYNSTGRRAGNCTLICHDYAHDGLNY